MFFSSLVTVVLYFTLTCQLLPKILSREIRPCAAHVRPAWAFLVFPLPPPLTHYSALPCTCPKRFFWAPAFCTPGHIGENSVSYPTCRKLSTLYVMSVLYNEVNIFGINITYLLTTYLLNKQKTFFFLHIVICYLNISHINVFFFFCLYPHC